MKNVDVKSVLKCQYLLTKFYLEQDTLSKQVRQTLEYGLIKSRKSMSRHGNFNT